MLDDPLAEIERAAYLRGDMTVAELAARLMDRVEPDDVEEAVDRATSELEDEVYDLEQKNLKLEGDRGELLRALKACVESMAGYRREVRSDQPCDAEAEALELIERMEADRG